MSFKIVKKDVASVSWLQGCHATASFTTLLPKLSTQALEKMTARAITPQSESVAVSSTTELAAAIRARRISSVEALDAMLARIERHNGALNAVVTMDVEAARARARTADAALERGQVWGPLHGVPFTLKDAFATAGMRTTVGFPPLDHVPDYDATVAARLKTAGGILVGKTNVAQLLADFQTDNPIFGRTNNPWDVALTPGGSSGGSAAAVASGMTPFEVATDLSGSIRIPSHFCGVFGFKPTEHRVSLGGIAPDPHNSPRTIRIASSVGPIARTVDDLSLIYSIIAGPDAQDTDVPPVAVEPVPNLALSKLRIAIAPQLGGFPIAADIRNAVESLGKQLALSGAVVEQPNFADMNLRDDLSSAGQAIGMAVGAAQPNQSNPTTLSAYMAALQRRDSAMIAWDRLLDGWDALLCAPAMVSAFAHCKPGTPLSVDGRKTDYFMVSGHATLFNYSGQPAVVLPCGLDREGRPIGVQLVGRRWDDSKLLGIARSVSEVSGVFRPPPLV